MPPTGSGGAAAGAAPVVFNASRSARAGDIVSIQGENFGTAPVVWLEASGSSPATPLAVANKVGTGWLAVQVPATANGMLSLRVSNGSNNSAAVPLNAATPHHLDATQIVPGGAFRLFGRNLMLPGSTPVVTVGGLTAVVNAGASNEHMLSVTAPAALPANAATVLTVDNGNGSGPATLERKIATVTGASGDPFALGVGWAAAFSALTSNVIAAATDPRLTQRVACDGATDDSPALQAALLLAARSGGGVVTLPAGVCKLGSGVQMFSNTVLQGAGKDRTELQHSINLPVMGYDADLMAVRNLAITNTGATAGGSLNFRNSTRVAVQGVRLNEGVTAMAWLYANTNLVISDSEFLQTGSVNATGAAYLADNQGLVFVGNRISFRNNIGTNFDHVRDAYVQGNAWTRDANRAGAAGVVHVVTLNFAHRLALVGNAFEVSNGPIALGTNDGETILTEGGGERRTEGLGMVVSATATSLFDSTARVNPNAFVNGSLPENYGIVIISGKGAGQSRQVTSFVGGSFSIDKPWDVTPDSTSRYATAVWGLEKAVIKGNTLRNNPMGILLYQSAVRDVDIVGNVLQENGGILIEAFQQQSAGRFAPVLNVRIDNNVNSNNSGRFASSLAVHFVNLDANSLGISHIGMEVRRNTLAANLANVDLSNYLGAMGRESYSNFMSGVHNGPYVTSAMPRLLGTVMQGNTCTNCATAFRLGTGAAGTSLVDSRAVNAGSLLSNQPTSTGSEAATDTWVR